ncbi:hypothetical protein ACHAPW_008999 [Verticillium nonalfalfae]
MDSGDDPETEKKIVQPSSTGSELVRVSSETQPGRTVLPEPVAKAISLATRSSSLALRVGTLITSYGFDAAKFTTLSSLELGRGILEGILHRAGQNAIARSQSTLARVDAETVIERSLESLHMAMSQIVFWTTAGFYVAETTFSAGSQITQLLLSSLDQFFGSTDSSRAIASIITLVRREFQNPATGHSGQKVGVTDLAMGICALAYLQQKCWKLPDEERRRAPQEEIVWDIVVLSDGERVDVHEDSLYGMHKGRYEPKGPGILVSKPGPSPGPDLIATLKRHASQDSGDEDDYLPPENRLRDQIMQSLPADTSVSITTSTHTQKTITVEFTGAESPALSPPPGVELVEREFIPAADGRRDVFSSTTGGAVTDQITQRVVYKFDKTMLRSTACRGYDQSPNVPGSVAEINVLLDGPDNPPPQLPERHKALEEPPPIPPRRRNSKAFEELATSPRSEQTMTPPASDSFHRQTSRKVSDSVLDIVKPQINTLSDNGSNQKRQRAPLGPVGTKRSSEPSPQAEELLSAKPRLTKSKTEPIKDGKLPPKKTAMDETHHEIRSFAHHTGSKAEDVLMASFVDSHGGSDTTGATGTGVPLVHYISLDHETKAVVLACRGTLGFEDVLADLACDYDDMSWRGKSYQVHKGVHASARRLLYGGDGRVLYTLKEALDEFSDYGLILCGHSLGGAVTALLGTMLAEPSPTGTGFVTSAEPHHRLLTYESSATAGSSGTTHVCLPSGRPIHVYAYGPPGTMSPALRKATRGLITSIVHGHDLVPYLSLGVLHDFQAVALAFQSDSTDASRLEARRRVWQAFQHGLADKWYATSTASLPENDQWALTALGSLRRSIVGTKLVPPGEVFVVESSKVLRRDAFVLAEEVDIGRPAKRVVLKYIRDVEARFGEVRFGTSMLMDHSPAKYEEALRKLRLGVVDAGY